MSEKTMAQNKSDTQTHKIMILMFIFALAFVRGEDTCNKVRLLGTRGVIVSPGYPLSYPNYTNCAWYIRLPTDAEITISFTDFDIEEDPQCESPPCCQYNWLSLGGDRDRIRLCGRDRVPPPFTSSKEELTVKFHTSKIIKGGRGFHLSYLIDLASKLSCESDEFQCANGKCILKTWICNSWDECGDSSDEKDCSALCLQPGQAPCGAREHRCYDISEDRCDGEWDCASGKDEKGCGECRSDQFRCHNHHGCYSSRHMCDGSPHCDDFSDELQCGYCEGNRTRCGPTSEECFDPLQQRCDGKLDCSNGADEVDCFYNCPGKIICAEAKGCYTMDQRCDGLRACGDASDEQGCTRTTCNAANQAFLCASGDCIPLALRCDRVEDCPGGSDEEGCLRNSVVTAAVMGSLICGLLLVVAVGCTCRLYSLRPWERVADTCNRNRMHRTSSSALYHCATTPLSGMEEQEEFLHREPPPPYSLTVDDVAGRYFERLGSNLAAPCAPAAVHSRPPHRIRRPRRHRHRPLPPPVLCSLPPSPSDPAAPLLSLPSVPEVDSPTVLQVPKEEATTSEAGMEVVGREEAGGGEADSASSSSQVSLGSVKDDSDAELLRP